MSKEKKQKERIEKRCIDCGAIADVTTEDEAIQIPEKKPQSPIHDRCASCEKNTELGYPVQ